MAWAPKVVVFVALAVLASGCTGGTSDADEASARVSGDVLPPSDGSPQSPVSPPSDGGQGRSGGSDDDDRLVATLPVWTAGQWWAYRVDHQGFGLSFQYKVVVAEAGPDGYALAATDEEGGTMALFTHYPPIGPVTTELVHHMHGQPVDLFDFPMRPGDTWEGDYRGERASYRVEQGQTLAGQDALVVRAEMADGARLEYEWVPGVGYFSALRFAFGPEGPWDHVLTVTDHGTNHTGDVVVRVVEDLLVMSGGVQTLPGNITAPSSDRGALTVPEGLDGVLGGLFTIDGHARVDLVTQGGEHHTLEGQSAEGAELTLLRMPATPGRWEQSTTGFEGQYFLELYALRERTVTL